MPETENEKIFKNSPFLYHKNMQLVTLNEKSNCTQTELTEFIKKGLVSQSDLVILDCLNLFQYLNKYCMEKYINTDPDIPRPYKKKDYKKTLKKLVKMGVILRHRFLWKTPEEDDGMSTYFYSLSSGAGNYIRKYRKHNKKIMGGNDFSVPDDVAVLHLLILNQFHIHFFSTYKPYIRHALFSHQVKIKNLYYTIDACYRLKCRKLSCGYIDIALITIRRNPGWQDEYIRSLALLYAASECCNNMDNPIVIILCEDLLQAKEAFVCQEKNEQVRNIATFFTTDIQIVREPILDYLSECCIIPPDYTENYANGYEYSSPLRNDTFAENFDTDCSSPSVEIVTKKLNLF